MPHFFPQTDLSIGIRKLQKCKNSLLALKNTARETKDFFPLLQQVANLLSDSSLTSNHNYKIAALFLLAEIYLEIALKSKQQLKVVSQTKAYIAAQDCLNEADKIFLEKDGQINIRFIASCNSRNLADPLEAKEQLASALLDDLLSCTEDQITHRIAPQGN